MLPRSQSASATIHLYLPPLRRKLANLLARRIKDIDGLTFELKGLRIPQPWSVPHLYEFDFSWPSRLRLLGSNTLRKLRWNVTLLDNAI